MTLTEDTTVYAHWKAGTTSYTVRVWKEAVPNGEYSPGNYVFAKTEEVKNVTTGSKVNGSDNYDFTDKKYYEFKEADKNVEVKGDGTTIVNVYYDLKLYTIKFTLSSRPGNKTIYGSFTKNGKTYGAGNNDVYSFQARYGEYIFDKWPQQSEVKAYEYDDKARKFVESKNYKFVKWGSNWASWRYTLAADIINDGNGTNISYTATFSNNASTYSATYWLQTPDKSGYEIDEKLTQKFLYFKTFGHKDLAGFTYLRETPKGYPSTIDSKNEYHFYYNRNALRLTFVSDAKTVKEEKVVYEQDLSEFKTYTPPAPASIAGQPTFEGWYTDEICSDTAKFDFASSTMPANNMTLYAKWTAETYDVSFNMNGADSEQIETQTVDYGKTANRPDNPERDGYRFGGWLHNGEVYNFDEHVTSDIELKAKWLKAEDKYQLIYMMDGKVIDSSGNYCDGSSAVTLGRPSGVPAGKAFIGWSFDSEATKVDVAPGAPFVVDHKNDPNEDKKIILYAVLKDENGTVNVVYSDGNNNTHTVNNIVINGNVVLLTPEECGFSAPDGEEFAGWKNANGEILAAGKTAAAGTGSNVLIAQWKSIPKTKVKVIITGSSGNVKYTGAEQSVAGFECKVVKANTNTTIANAVKVSLKQGKVAKASGIIVGEYAMNLEKDDFNFEVATRYELVGTEINDGKLTINPYELTVNITGNNDTVVENEVEQSVSGFKAVAQGSGHPSTFDIKNVLWKGGQTPVAKGTNPGRYEMGLDKEDFSYDDKNDDKNLILSYEVTDGWLEINPAKLLNVVISGKVGDPVTYDGEEHEVKGFDYEVEIVNADTTPVLRSRKAPESNLKDAVSVKLKDGKTAVVAGTDVGTYNMGLDGDSFVVTVPKGYKLAGDPTVNDGSITINPYKLTVNISGNVKSVPENGSEQSVDGFEAKPQGTDVPSTFKSAAILWKGGQTPVAKGTDPDTYYMGLNPADFTYEDEGSKNFELTFNLVKDGQLDITPVEHEGEIIVPTDEKKEENKSNNDKQKSKEEDVLDDFEDDSEVIDDVEKERSGNRDTHTSDNTKTAVKAGVQTGDNVNLILYIMVFCLGVISLIMMRIVRSKPSRRK